MDIQTEAREAGVQPDYFDAQGQYRAVPHEALRRVLDALPKNDAHAAIVHRVGSAQNSILIQAEGAVRFQLFEEERCVAAGKVSDRRVELPDTTPTGIYRLNLIGSDRRVMAAMPLLVVPPTAYSGDFDRVWLLAVQLYGLRSERNWGIGDFSDLHDLIEVAANLGAAGIGLNPLHVLFDDHPNDCSPYAPNSRLFLNPIYIDVEAVAEFGSVSPDMKRAIAEEKARALIDYSGVAKWKLAALTAAFDIFTDSATNDRRSVFDAFRKASGRALQRFAYFEVMRKKLRTPWWEWSSEIRDVSDDDVARHRAGQDRELVEFVEFLQWTAHEQLQRCADYAKACGLKVGLYLDVAVGVRADGFDAWSERDAVSRQLSVGAPPDMLNTAGQDWGLAGFNPAGLAARDFEPFRAMIAASARYAGAIRLDHVMGLSRLYLIPSGFSARDGAYVTMPLEALLGVVALESQRASCVVIGEDLGTVPEGFRDRLAEWGVWSYQVMMFEREHGGGFKAAASYPRNALVTFNTHDLPSYAGWRAGHDLGVKRAIGVDPGESDDDRRRSIGALKETLRGNGEDGSDFLAVASFLSATPSRILSLSIEDLLGVREQANVPGTVDSHPNWRRRLPCAVSELRSVAMVQELAGKLSGRK